ncbi:uncharacterized protein LOC135384162 [Ornithodoros turicata]|uniref:uncharacterized protein LOC135384162 n=1 Tax=Ornithodoros turicata TaxID=34597 RepID=UPI003139BC77
MANPGLLTEHQHLMEELKQMMGAGERVGPSSTPLKGILKNTASSPLVTRVPQKPSTPPPPPRSAAVTIMPTRTHSSPTSSPKSHEQLHVHVSVNCSCERPPTTEASTQTPDDIPRKVTFNETPQRTCRRHLAASHSDHFQCGRISPVKTYEERAPSPQSRKTSGQLKPGKRGRRRSIEEVLSRVRDTLLEVLEDATPTEFIAATPQSRWNCAIGLLESLTEFRDDGDDDSLGVGVLDLTPVKEDLTVEQPEKERIQPRSSPNLTANRCDSSEALVMSNSNPAVQRTELVTPPPQAARLAFDCNAEVRKIINDHLSYIAQDVEAQWDETCVQLRNDFGRRYRHFVEDCRQCLAESRTTDHEQLRQEILEARRELLSELKASFRLTCLRFETWWKDYIQREVHESQRFLRKGKGYRVLAGVLKYEIMDSIADIEAATRRKAADLWKELVAQRNVSFEAMLQDMCT